MEKTVKSVERSGLSWQALQQTGRVLSPANLKVKLLQDKARDKHPGREVLAFHCILKQESLCKSALKIPGIIESVVDTVNTI